MISRHTIQRVIDAADVVDVVGGFMKLKKRGANYIGNCPFHNEKTPSFSVSPSKGIYKCFGCGKAGNSVTFLQEHEKLTYPEAIVWLARKYNIPVEETLETSEQKENKLIEESLRIVNQYAANYFQDYLFNNQEGLQIGMTYFKHRGYNEDTIKKFGLGYSPENKKDFPQKAIQQKYQTEQLLKAGLIKEKNGEWFAAYPGRVIFPIHNQSGRIIGFGARLLKSNDKAPKYINTPENEIYSKSKTLYGLYFAKNAISKLDECLLVEGYTDVISLHQSGIENVVASSGTSLTEDQLRLIKRLTPNIIILYDGDSAGIKAALRGLDMALTEGMNVQLVLLPDNHDPDSFIQSVGNEGFKEYIQKNKKDIVLFKLEVALAEAKNDVVKKSALINDIADTISKINRIEDFTKQQDYIKRCAALLQIDEGGLISLVNKKIREQVYKNYSLDEKELSGSDIVDDIAHDTQSQSDMLLQKDYQQEKSLITVLLEYGNKPYDDKISVAEYVKYKIGDAEFENKKWEILYRNYFNELQSSLQYPAISFFTYHDNESIRLAAIEALKSSDELSENWEKKHQIIVPNAEQTYLQFVNDTITYFLLRKIKAIYNDLLEELKNMQENNEEEIIILNSLGELKVNEMALMEQYKTVLVR